MMADFHVIPEELAIVTSNEIEKREDGIDDVSDCLEG
jgi:hypothetical protein